MAIGPALVSVIAVAAGRWLEASLYGVSGRDAAPIAFTAVALVGLALAAAGASAAALLTSARRQRWRRNSGHACL